jgi:hypothetical protein
LVAPPFPEIRMNLLTRIAAALGVRVLPERMQPYVIRETEAIGAAEHCSMLANHMNDCAHIAQAHRHSDAAIWLDAREHVLAIGRKLAASTRPTVEREWAPQAAAHLLLRICRRLGKNDPWPTEGDEALRELHVRDMLMRVANGEITGRKAHRWLGWAQCAAVAAGVGTLEDMKAINKAASDEAEATPSG